MGRPPIEIDKEQFEKLCKLQCTEVEICDFFRITDKTLAKWCKKTYDATFYDVFRQKRGAGKVSLRRMQWQLAEKSPAMAIFLGKQLLGQKDKMELTEMERHRIDCDKKLLELKERELDMKENGW